MMSDLVPQILPLVIWPDPRLYVEVQDVTEFDVELEQLIVNMFATMRAKNGIGLAAPQVASSKNVFVIDVPQINNSPATGPLVFINPSIICWDTENFTWEEGCLSVPGYFSKRERSYEILIEYQDIKGEKQLEKFRELPAFVIQHEWDHVCPQSNSDDPKSFPKRVFVDGLSKLKTDRIKKRIRTHLKRVGS